MNEAEHKLIITRIRIGRAKNKCEHCGSHNGEYEMVNGKLIKTQLTVVPLDLNPDNMTDANLAALCQTCKQNAEEAFQQQLDKANGGSVQGKLF